MYILLLPCSLLLFYSFMLSDTYTSSLFVRYIRFAHFLHASLHTYGPLYSYLEVVVIYGCYRFFFLLFWV
ncbi:hypothetical protein C8J57DRAFT_1275867 [Mycena rebaudengoi]|nr:hypothetical protein C8J57DRAFT_1275867 [Mycena rebaudengoi]